VPELRLPIATDCSIYRCPIRLGNVLSLDLEEVSEIEKHFLRAAEEHSANYATHASALRVGKLDSMKCIGWSGAERS
jgi:hypothetical protein